MALYRGTKNLDLSEQELLDCTSGNGVGHCDGNWPEPIYDYQKSQGQVAESSYKYVGKQQSCSANGKSKIAKVTNYFKAPVKDENALKEWVGTYGVHSIVIEVNDAFMSYRSGIFDVPCGNTRYI